MNVLVTGGAGYVGSVTVEVLIDCGHYVVVLDNLNIGNRQAVHPEAAFIHADITDSESVIFALLEHDIEAVVHFAFLNDQESPAEYFERNTAASLSLLQTLLKYGVRKLVLSSTATIFSQYATLPIDEQTPIALQDAYSESIYLVERMLPWLNQTQGLSYTSLRYFNAAGATERSISKRHIVDVAKAHVLAIESLSDGDAKTYNLSDEGWFSEPG